MSGEHKWVKCEKMNFTEILLGFVFFNAADVSAFFILDNVDVL